MPFGEVTAFVNSSGVPNYWLTIEEAPRTVCFDNSNDIEGSSPCFIPASARA